MMVINRYKTETQQCVRQRAINRLVSLLVFVVVCASGFTASGQADPLKTLVASFDTYRQQALQEKIFLHIDRPLYVAGETMWFKTYYLDGSLHQPLDLSKIAYVEVLDSENQPVLQGKIALRKGLGNGSFELPFDLNSGNYKVRAYTNWMKNFSPAFYFEQPVTIINTFKNAGLKPVTDTAYAIQFFPEGGNLVNGIQSKVAFKVTEAGKGIACEGEVVDQDGHVLAQFQTLKFGMGTFVFQPEQGKQYTALVKMPQKRQVMQQALPTAQEQGYVLQVGDASATELKIKVTATSRQVEPVYLLGHARQIIAVAETDALRNGETVFTVNKAALPEGITHLTLFNSQKQPVCERLYFKRPATKLEIAAQTAKSFYGTREKVSLELQTTTSGTGAATAANLSLAVYRLDQLPSAATTPADIRTYLWLSSDLKGTIEQPAFYFAETGPAANEALDNLMLTHGWSRFRWEDVLTRTPAAISFAPEYDGHLITGKITHKVTDSPAPGITAYLAAPGRHVRHYSATSASDGTIQFEAKDFYGPKEIVVQSNTLQDSSYQLQILSPFSDKFSFTRLPAFAITDRLQPEIAQRHLEVQLQHAYFSEKQQMFRSPEIDSTAFYGEPDERYLLDEFTRFKQLEEVLHEFVTAVRARKRRGDYQLTVLDRPGNTIFADNPLVLLDGVPVFDMNKVMAIDPLTIQKLEVMAKKYYHGPRVYKGIMSLSTYKGDLGTFKLDPRSLLLEYEGQQLQREFYAPAYATAEVQQSRLADRRNLLHWAPNLIAGTDGKVSVEFYTADQPGTYLVVLQGINQFGVAGSKVFSFEVKQAL
ncbi:hypothetical protein ACMA1I_04910 [Pontibacter sp. 13R65]|uniref:hypothetical protein n=1 Tax=Pontibacter sp. 13R65 TaxID=3127458 RepID=UPI00301BA81D